uniref:B and T lymphocyte associated n=1 Tax=Equus asinus asinus TaxID=83772 RepID=A0A8C4LT30_EQUAS
MLADKSQPKQLGPSSLFRQCLFDKTNFLGTALAILRGKSCDIQLYIKRDSLHTVSVGSPLQLKCPVSYCANRPNVTWCKLEEKSCSYLRNRPQTHTSWEAKDNISIFVLHFDQVLVSDNGSYRCSANIPPGVIESHSITVIVTDFLMSLALTNISDATSASATTSKEETADKRWILYSFLPLGGLPLLITCFYLFFCLRRHQGGFRLPLLLLGTRQNSQTLPSETGIYDNDPLFGVQEESGVYSNPCLEDNKQGIVYASLNHSLVGINPRQARNVKEAPTEYAAICVRS